MQGDVELLESVEVDRVIEGVAVDGFDRGAHRQHRNVRFKAAVLIVEHKV